MISIRWNTRDAHARLDQASVTAREVFDRDLLDMRIVTPKIVIKTTMPSAVARRS